MAFDLPRNVMTALDDVEVRLDPAPHPFELDHAEAIDAHWQIEAERNPHLFDGRIVMLSALALRGRKLVGRCHEVRFATLLYWRSRRSNGIAEHSFADAALVSSDNALVAIRMGGHTANPGAVYFASGTFEPADFRDGLCDLDANMMREVMEETGLDISKQRRDDGYVLFSAEHSTAIFRRFWMDEDAETLAQRIRDFVASQSEPEIEGPVIIRRGEPLPGGTRPYITAFANWHFSQ